MATKIQVLDMPEYGQYIMMAMIEVSRDILNEGANVPLHAQRVNMARQILQNPNEKVLTFKNIVIVTFNTTTYESLTETQKISGAKTLVANVFNEAMYIYNGV